MHIEFNQDKVLKKLADNNQQALEELFNHYYPRLYKFSKSWFSYQKVSGKLPPARL
ncbi:hypothetical protein [Sunxiuqinia rutila]|uniref:hypothetical protein n=1 Tax=Sunxiuqinia rutila TaxID=1397841 RepID=UPI003D36543A